MGAGLAHGSAPVRICLFRAGSSDLQKEGWQRLVVSLQVQEEGLSLPLLPGSGAAHSPWLYLHCFRASLKPSHRDKSL